MTSCSVETFQLLVQWLYVGGIVLDDFSHHKRTNSELMLETFGFDSKSVQKLLPVDKSAREIISLLAFLKLADEIDLLGSFNNLVNSIKWKIIDDRACLRREHIRMAMEFPAGHAARTLIVQACVKAYISRMFTAPGDTGHTLWYRAELDELDGFAADLLREFTKALDTKRRESGYIYYLPDPLSGEKINFYAY